MQWIQFYTLQVMTSAALLKIGNILHPEARYQAKREFNALSHIIQEASDGICSITASYVVLCSQPATDHLEMPQMRTTQALLLIWPLFCVSTAPGLTDGQKCWAREVLWAIGEQRSIPKALSLVRCPLVTIVPIFILEEVLIRLFRHVQAQKLLPNPISWQVSSLSTSHRSYQIPRLCRRAVHLLPRYRGVISDSHQHNISSATFRY